MAKENNTLQRNGYQAPAVHRAFKLLRAVAQAPHGLKLVELSEQLGFSRSTTHGLVHALLREKALVQGEDAHQLFLGPTIADLAFTDWNYVQLTKLAQPIIDEIRDRVNATVFLGVRIHKRVLIIASAEAGISLKISAPVGTTIPLFAGAVGKVLLAYETPERIVQLLGEKGFPRYTPKSIVTMDKYLTELELARTRGYASEDEEYLMGIQATAVALNNRRGLPIAIWVVAIGSNMGPGKLEEVAETLMSAAKTLKLQLEGSSRTGFKPTVGDQAREGNPRALLEQEEVLRTSNPWRARGH